jgi:hypothetical protein
MEILYPCQGKIFHELIFMKTWGKDEKIAKKNYWFDLFIGVTWQECKAAGGKGSGFRGSRWNTVQKIKPGDYFLCYLTGGSRLGC